MDAHGLMWFFHLMAVRELPDNWAQPLLAPGEGLGANPKSWSRLLKLHPHQEGGIQGTQGEGECPLLFSRDFFFSPKNCWAAPSRRDAQGLNKVHCCVYGTY